MANLSHVVALIGDLVTWLGQRGHPFSEEQIDRVQAALGSLGASDEETAAAVGADPVTAPDGTSDVAGEEPKT